MNSNQMDKKQTNKNQMNKYTIIGSGPCGLSLAYVLSLNDIEVEIIEQDSQLGGSWNAEWKNDKYFSENSPRIYSDKGNAKKLMTHLGFTSENYQNVYGNFYETNMKLLRFIWKHFSLLDYFKFIFATIKYKFIEEKNTLAEWMNQMQLSSQCKKAIRIISILVNDIPERTNINDFFGVISYVLPKQMKEPNKWHELIENHLLSKNVKIFKNTKVIHLEKNGDEFYIMTKHMMYGYENERFSNKVFLCTQSNGIYPIIQNSSLRDNWMPSSEMKKWCENTFYSGFGFQLHFNEIVEYKNEWCWSCYGDWTVIILPVSNWLKEYSKDPEIKTVWSCCIVDMETKSKRINKTANECDKNEIIDECYYQIKQTYDIPYPKAITISSGITKINNKWVSKNTGYTRNTYDDLNMKGKEDNLYALGCFTKSLKNSISYMTTAIDATAEYLKKYEKLENNIFA